MLNSVIDSMCKTMLNDLEQQKQQFLKVIDKLTTMQLMSVSETLRNNAQREQFKVRRVLTSLERAQESAVINDTAGLARWTGEMRAQVLELDIDLLRAA